LSRKAIFTADDFGLNEPVNDAIRQAHLYGVLTSASLMVNGDAVRQAVAMAKALPELSVGLHLVLTSGRATLPPGEIPHLADPRGAFREDAFAAGLHYFFDPRARRELRLEMRAQFEAYVQTGLPLSHVNGHLHMHMHPAVFPILVAFMQEFGVRGIRIPRDDLALALAYDRESAPGKILTNAVFRGLAACQRRRVAKRKLLAVERTYGLLQSGHMNTEYMLLVLGRSACRTVEVYAHPTTGSRMHELGPNPGDLRALIDPRVHHAVAEYGFERATYASLNEGEP
jgi:hopanoid biosynthesis associated protein HpnK